MNVKYLCMSCGEEYAVPQIEGHAAERVKCPACGSGNVQKQPTPPPKSGHSCGGCGGRCH